MSDAPVPEFSLTPEEERFFVRFFRQRMLPTSAGVSVAAAVLVALLIAAGTGEDGRTPPPAPRDPGPTEPAGLAPPLIDEGARTRLDRLEKQLAELAESVGSGKTRASSADLAGDVAALQRDLAKLRKELNSQATTVAQLKDRPSVPASAADGDADLSPLAERVFNLEVRQDREEKDRLEATKKLGHRVFSLEEASASHERNEGAASAQLRERVERLERALLERDR